MPGRPSGPTHSLGQDRMAGCSGSVSGPAPPRARRFRVVPSLRAFRFLRRRRQDYEPVRRLTSARIVASASPRCPPPETDLAAPVRPLVFRRMLFMRVIRPSTPAKRHHLALRWRTCCLREWEPSRPRRSSTFRGSFPRPAWPLSTLQTPRCRDARKTRSRPARYAGGAPPSAPSQTGAPFRANPGSRFGDRRRAAGTPSVRRTVVYARQVGDSATLLGMPSI